MHMTTVCSQRLFLTTAMSNNVSGLRSKELEAGDQARRELGSVSRPRWGASVVQAGDVLEQAYKPGQPAALHVLPHQLPLDEHGVGARHARLAGLLQSLRPHKADGGKGELTQQA